MPTTPSPVRSRCGSHATTREEPAVRLAHHIGAHNLTGRPGHAASLHHSDPGQAQRAVPPASAGREAEAIAMVLEAKTGETMLSP
jgi:hypothetical protein